MTMTITEQADQIYEACKAKGFETYFERAQFTNSVYVIVYKGNSQFKIRVSDHKEGYLRSNFIDLRPESKFNLDLIVGSLEVN